MVALDTSLMERAEQHFCDAFVTFGYRGDDLVRIAQEITMAGKRAGLTKLGRRRMLDHLYAFIDTLPQTGLDPFARGRRVDDPASLFVSEKLGGLFDGVPSAGLAEQADLGLRVATAQKVRFAQGAARELRSVADKSTG